MDLKSTLNLPDADFTIPMKADLPVREPRIQARWKELDVYRLIQEARADAPEFVLHDGPPYTNGPIHLGTAMNKILKDFVVKSRTMMGYRAPFVPGFDNHGLPIELTVMRGFQERGETPDLLTLRRACRDHAARYVDVQSRQFQRLGVFGLWDRPYTTMDYRFEAGIIRVFKRLVEQGHVYRGLRPVLWSPTSRTALADTEVVYEEVESPSIYVKFPLRTDLTGWARDYPRLSTVIWTTTPWTIPANLAVAFHPTLEYQIVRVGDEHWLLLGERVPAVMAELGIDAYEVVATLLGASFERSVFSHPLFDRPSLGVLASYVTTDEGTGVVHTAPGHGREDFLTGARYGLDVLCPVDEAGRMTEEAGPFAGMSLAECNEAVIAALRERGALLRAASFRHNYPHAERDGQPVIFRTTDQWFVSIDEGDLRERMLEQIGSIRWIPASGEARIRSMIQNRPDWCISRQRPWGVGIPVFYGRDSRVPVLDPVAIEAVACLVEKEGSDAWFERPAREILPPGYRHPATGETEFDKETDVFDVWFDSACTNLCVLEGEVEPLWKARWPADLFLEGSDQHRGWFNVSLIVANIARGEAPYREVITHGFVIDEKGLKMSKRFGNVVDPVEACERYGADVLRVWCASVDTTEDVPCSDGILQQCGEMYRTVRNTFRFLLANLFDYDAAADPPLTDLDRWVLERVDLLVADVVDAYQRYDFTEAFFAVHNFCATELSPFYLDAIKDRMYCDRPDGPRRRSAQRACHAVLLRLLKLVAPILVHTAEEVYERLPGLERRPSVHMELFDLPSEERLDAIRGSELQARFALMLETRSWVFSEFEKWKGTEGVKDSQDAVATVWCRPDVARVLREFGEDLPLYFKLSWITVEEGEDRVEFAPSPYPKCERSRLRRPDVEQVNGVWLSKRDRQVLGYE